MNIDNLTEEQIRNLEIQKKFRPYGSSGIHPDRVGIENMDEDQIRSLEAQRNRNDFGPSGIHPDRVGIENMDEDQIRSLEAQVSEKRRADIPYMKYFEELVNNPIILDEKQFEDAVIYSMQSNGVIQKFMNDLLDKISDKTYSFKSIDVNNKEEVNRRKLEIEQLIYLYERYLYKLKDLGWNYGTIGFDVASMKISEPVQNTLWKLQKEYGISFELSIPANLGEDYGVAFERTGKLIPGLTLMYDELNNKEVNWHQVINYREGELTPYQRFSQRR